MRYRTCLLSVLPLMLGVALMFNTAAIAGDLPKEGTYSATYSTYGTVKAAAQVGKEVLLVGWDESGLSVGKGILDHVTWHCWGLFNIINGTAQTTGGYCVVTDPILVEINLRLILPATNGVPKTQRALPDWPH